MEQAEFDLLVNTPDDLIKKIQALKKDIDVETYRKQYDPQTHDVNDPAIRKNKVVQTDNGIDNVESTRTSMSKQRQIVMFAAAILCGNPIKLNCAPIDQKEKDMLAVMIRTWQDNKLDYESKKILKLMMIETEVAELWYTEPCEPGYWKGTPNDIASVKFRLRMKVLANKYGDTLYPIYTNSGDMLGFARGYSIKVGDKNEEHFDVYTGTKFYFFIKADAWVPTVSPNSVGKICVVYHSQDEPEWLCVQPNIARSETLVSNLGESNDYSGSPITLLFGDVKGYAKKGEQGKVLIMEQGADARYLESTNAPAAIELEYNIQRSIIYEETNTPDLSVENLKGLGVFSGSAIRLLFLPSHMKAAEKEEQFGVGIQRRINYLKAALATINIGLKDAINMVITPQFEYFVPKNEEELITMLSTATGGKPTMSQETALVHNPFVTDPVLELEKLKKEGLDEAQSGGL